jgi:hypothetical protein
MLSGRFVPLGLALLAPVVVNIRMYHFLLIQEGWQPWLSGSDDEVSMPVMTFS